MHISEMTCTVHVFMTFSPYLYVHPPDIVGQYIVETGNRFTVTIDTMKALADLGEKSMCCAVNNGTREVLHFRNDKFTVHMLPLIDIPKLITGVT